MADRLFEWRQGGHEVGLVHRPEIRWIGVKTGYLWVGNDKGECLFTMSGARARRLRDFLNAGLGAAKSGSSSERA